jgi:phosphatidylserine/phosphatidylglycerophosphate/cardiolipin synthase-like enzyme
LYVTLLDEADDLACITFAFTVPDLFKVALKQNSSDGPLCFLLLEKEDRPAQNSSKPFIRLNAENNVYMASGAELQTTLGRWVIETDTRKLGLNRHVAFIHCKFLLHDPLGDDPIVVTGSANFSAASTSENDENMVIVRGDRRVAGATPRQVDRRPSRRRLIAAAAVQRIRVVGAKDLLRESVRLRSGSGILGQRP